MIRYRIQGPHSGGYEDCLLGYKAVYVTDVLKEHTPPSSGSNELGRILA
jgi:hypothetical protein